MNSIYFYIFWAFSIIAFCQTALAQQIKSQRTVITLNKETILEKYDNNEAPVIYIISPYIHNNQPVTVNEGSLNIVGKVKMEGSGINKIFINDEFYQLPGDGSFVKKVTLQPGENTISITALDRDNKFYEKKVKVVYKSPLQNLVELNVEGEYFGLIIGINEYEDFNFNALDNPIHDAQKMYDVLTSQYSFKQENVHFIKNAKINDIYTALDDLDRRVTNKDNLLIFYAGHGWWDESANVGYWLPSDSKVQTKAQWFRNSTLCDYLKEIDSKHTLLIADACFGGSIFKSRGVSMEAPKAIKKLYELPSRKAMTSGTLTEVPDRSTFSRYLVDRLKENDQAYISSEQLFASFRIAVINNSDVVPQYGEIKNVGDEGGDFIFIKKKE